MNRSIRSTLLRSGAALTATLLAAGVAAAPAHAHDAPKVGSTCAMSGMVEYNHGDVYVCVSKAEGAKPRWGKGTTVSRSQLAITDGWSKAADTGMSAAFGMLKNPTNKPIRVVGATSTYSKVVQLHEVVAKDGSMVMQQKSGGFVIPAGGMLELKPGGNHLMFMGITKPIKAGTMVPITLITADGGVMKTKVIAKVFMGANEDYDDGMSDMSGM
jgi:copper(I)-binding protein